ncbi:MAG: hypothetical protein EAZ39_28915 [Oscillatoriales cyanobacterium]|nr:MAG: hypothetical protein EAZ45_08925 [Oscillatoriales cyanobacterium]TAG13185.1 MAG: hypothetical protein EAZ39_28915 [Oscillatoriales cyanobacterium]TAG36856.1 MAG: hypothetical protein EAZ33_22965 [Oscillatoriales cyanobacterium]TAG57734.1 MAG: hypothetical protein EAZ28_17200 [Oscillatoriales cyanobacterium]
MSSKQSRKQNNTLVITSPKIARFRSELAAYPEALKALDEIEDCEVSIEYFSTRFRQVSFVSPRIRFAGNLNRPQFQALFYPLLSLFLTTRAQLELVLAGKFG